MSTRVKAIKDIPLGGFFKVPKGALGTIYRTDKAVKSLVHVRFDTGQDIAVSLGREVRLITRRKRA